jgi:chemotaxis protein MotB
MDRSVLTQVNVFSNEVNFMTYRGAGRVPTRIRLLVELLTNPWDIVEKPNRFKDLLFPDDVLPPEIDRSTLEENLEVLVRKEGVALVLSDKLLFRPGSAELTPLARKILAPVSEVLLYMHANVNVAGHSDSTTGATVDNYVLSGERALSVLDYFLESGMDKRRFSVSGYGPQWPVADNDTVSGRARNRRVEILVKTTPMLGGYYS